MATYICLGKVPCESCNKEHVVYVDFGKAYPSRRIDFRCPETMNDVSMMGYAHRAYTIHMHLPADAIVGEVYLP